MEQYIIPIAICCLADVDKDNFSQVDKRADRANIVWNKCCPWRDEERHRPDGQPILAARHSTITTSAQYWLSFHFKFVFCDTFVGQNSDLKLESAGAVNQLPGRSPIYIQHPQFSIRPLSPNYPYLDLMLNSNFNFRFISFNTVHCNKGKVQRRAINFKDINLLVISLVSSKQKNIPTSCSTSTFIDATLLCFYDPSEYGNPSIWNCCASRWSSWQKTSSWATICFDLQIQLDSIYLQKRI